MKKISFYVGINDKDEKKQIISTEKAQKIIEGIFYDIIGGATIYNGTGIYTHEDGKKVIENTFICEVFDIDIDYIRIICEYLKKALNQESIAINITEIECMFL